MDTLWDTLMQTTILYIVLVSTIYNETMELIGMNGSWCWLYVVSDDLEFLSEAPYDYMRT